MSIKDWLLGKTIEAQSKVMPSYAQYLDKLIADMNKNIAWYQKKHGGAKPTAKELGEVYTKSNMFMQGAKAYGMSDRDIFNFAADALKGE